MKISILLFVPLLVSTAAFAANLDKRAPPVSVLLPRGGNSNYVSRLQSGRAIYVGPKCLRCHYAEKILKYSDPDWKEDILPGMARRARLKPQELQDLQAYIYLVLEKRQELGK